TNNEDEFFVDLIESILKEKNPTKTKLNQLKISLSKKYNFKRIVKNPEIIAHSNDSQRDRIIEILNIKPIRELSGVTVVALFAKPHSCPHGKCMYCPGGPDSPYGDTPQSYTGMEPAALRAIRNNYDPYLQVFNRLEHYCINGHVPDKLELIFMGGTFPSLDKKYRDEFVNFVYKAINDFGEEFIIFNKKKEKIIDYNKFNEFFESKSELSSVKRSLDIRKKVLELKKKDIRDYKYEINRNETGIIRSIGLTIETKPDWALEKHCNEALEYGCTRFEVGVQTLNEECLKKTNRGHTLDDTKKAFQVMKDMCFKINAHMMLGLPASNLDIDKKSLIDLFALNDFRPDMLKFYPCLVVKGTPLYNMWEKGLFKPIDTKESARIIAEVYETLPRYVRVMRVQRDIPTTEINDGIRNSNLRQFVEEEMKEKNIESKDIRAREIGIREVLGYKVGNFEIKTEMYASSGGIDYFIDAVDSNDTLIGFIRLRFPGKTGLRKEITSKTALIRELHVYGQTLQVGNKDENIGNEISKVQHKGWGRKLLEKAEHIAKENGYEKMVIISGVGVREYYRKFGYVLEGPYMVKNL
ncbi:MAG: tRNA uridine(34) 5-carboxymethylaminomethyl modification radical SAM/GNAT enzyme Elp3, partial [Nanoarchaeota archaeon]|nr:tRNA uridine(34) 5-carboxymethylaminomethyl modification radical SAM/GNAT enzyme Elp3 [Nanoarchaeota archaeon]